MSDFLAVGNSEPTPDHLPEEIKKIINDSKRGAGFNPDGSPMTTDNTQELDGMMTNYNERLDEITIDLWVKYGRPGTMDEFVPEAKQAITSLIKELVAEAKPEKKSTEDYGSWEEGHRNVGYNRASIEFEQNLLKALEEL